MAGPPESTAFPSQGAQAVGQSQGRDRPPPQPPPSCCSCGAQARSVAQATDTCAVPLLPVHSRQLHLPESLGQLDGGHPLSTTGFDYPISSAQLSLSFGLSAPVRAPVSSEANSQDRRGNNSFPPSDPQLKVMLNESAFLLG